MRGAGSAAVGLLQPWQGARRRPHRQSRCRLHGASEGWLLPPRNRTQHNRAGLVVGSLAFGVFFFFALAIFASAAAGCQPGRSSAVRRAGYSSIRERGERTGGTARRCGERTRRLRAHQNTNNNNASLQWVRPAGAGRCPHHTHPPCESGGVLQRTARPPRPRSCTATTRRTPLSCLPPFPPSQPRPTPAPRPNLLPPPPLQPLQPWRSQ